jgi:hypothetical protein
MNCQQVAEGEIVEKYLTGRLESSLQDDFEVHLLECRECLALLETCEAARPVLAAQGGEISQATERQAQARERWRWGWFTPQRVAGAASLAALMVIALLAAVWGGLIPLRRPGPTQVQSPTPGSPNPSGLAASFPEIAALSLNQQQQVADTIQTGRISYSPDLGELAGKQGALRGESGHGSHFAVLGPVGEVVNDPEPLFRWQPLAGAKSYSVSVYDTGLAGVAKSPPLRDTQWKATKPLRRDRVFQWQVTATMRDGKRIISPDSSEPVAKFRVLGEAESNNLKEFQKAHPDAHLVLGILNAQAGVLEVSKRELGLVQEGSRDYQLAQQLLRSVRERR